MNEEDEKTPKEQTENCLTRTAPPRRRSSIFSTPNKEKQDISSNCEEQVDSPPAAWDAQYMKSLEEYWNNLNAVRTRSREMFQSIDDGIPLREKIKNVKLDPFRQAILDEADRILEEYTTTATDLITRNEVRKEELKFRIDRMKGVLAAIQPE